MCNHYVSYNIQYIFFFSFTLFHLQNSLKCNKKKLYSPIISILYDKNKLPQKKGDVTIRNLNYKYILVLSPLAHH